MGDLSIIEWTHSTLNFWRGCDKVDPTCANCYMFRDQRRYGRDPSVVVRCSPSTFQAPLRSKKWAKTRDRFLAELGYHLVFVCSWSDFFHEAADPWRADAWDVIRRTPQSTYQILTSRPERILEHLPPDWGQGWPNVWMGVTIGNRKFVHRADQLRAVPARAVHQRRTVAGTARLPRLPRTYLDATDPARWCAQCASPHEYLRLDGIDWLIVGGESGGRAGRRLVDEHNQPRADRIGWVRDLRDACRLSLLGASPEEPTAFLFKQWGGATPKSGGRELDGRTWDELPATANRDLTG